MTSPQTRPAAAAQGKGPAAGRATCAWAACDAPASDVVEGWPMCAPHVLAHVELEGRPPIRRRGLTLQQRYEAVRELHAQGYSDPRIAAVVGCTRSWVRQLRRDLGLPANVPSPSARSERREIRHGTEAGAKQHSRRGDAPCQECRRAMTLARQERKERSA